MQRRATVAYGDEDICSICRDDPADVYVCSPCGHAYCGHCIIKVLFRQVAGIHGTARNSCPVCRTVVVACSSTSLPYMMDGREGHQVLLQLGRVKLEVDVPSGGQVLARLATLTGVPPARIKLLHKGRQLTTNAEILCAAGTGARLTLLPALLSPVSWTGVALQLFRNVLNKARAGVSRLTWPLWRRFLLPTLRQMHVCLEPTFKVMKALALSLNPSYPGVVSARGQRQEAGAGEGGQGA
mmetsp:Transcript_18652/g.31798  ORF Transcript_18652/g.31798 Transcript_18652/m.31798 type:complete len:240 (+) Transcript_18652:168-887(+)